MDFQQFKSLVIARAEALGIGEYELYYQTGESVSVSVYGTEVSQFSSSVDGGVCFRCIVEGKMGYASTEALTESEAAAIVDRAAENAALLESREPVFLGEGGKTYPDIPDDKEPLPDADALIALAMDAQNRMLAHPDIAQGTNTQAVAESSCVAICNSRGLDLRHESRLVGMVTAAVVARDGEKANHHTVRGGKASGLDPEDMTARAIGGALDKLGAGIAPTGQYPVVFSPEAMSSLLSVYSSAFSAEAAQKGLSPLAGKEGEVIASSLVTLVDDPAHPHNPLPMPFDAEGTPAAKKAVVEAGRLNTLLYNLKTGAVAGKASTGNAAKGSYNATVGTRPFTFYLAGGDMTEEALLQKAGSGVYINFLTGLHAGANAVSGDFSLESGGFLIENGVKTAPVKSFTVAGNFFTMLQNITGVSDTVVLPSALGATAFGAPCVLVEGLSIAGN